MKVFTHSELVEIGYKWCINKCAFAFKELVTLNGTGEIPDIIGFKDDGTFLLEAKTSYSDFLSDKKKWFRKRPEYGMGDWRFYICPVGMIKIDELFPGWGLIEVNEKGKARTIYNPFGKGNVYSRWRKQTKNYTAEQAMMFSALRRLHIRNRIDEIYETVPRLIKK